MYADVCDILVREGDHDELRSIDGTGLGILREHTEVAMDVDDAGAAALV